MRRWIVFGVGLALVSAACGGGGGGGENCGVATGGGEARFCSAAGGEFCVCATNRCAREDSAHCLSGYRYLYGAGECVPAEAVGTAIESSSVHDLCPVDDGGADADADVEPDGADADADVEPDGADADADADVEPDGADADADADVEPDGADADADVIDGGDATVHTTVMSLTAGGGTAVQGSFQMTLSVGTPQPMGSQAGGTRQIGLGPGAVQNQ